MVSQYYNLTENALRHASGPVHANIPSVTNIVPYLSLKTLAFGLGAKFILSIEVSSIENDRVKKARKVLFELGT